MSNIKELLKQRIDAQNCEKLLALDNPKLHEFVADAIELLWFKASVLLSRAQAIILLQMNSERVVPGPNIIVINICDQGYRRGP